MTRVAVVTGAAQGIGRAIALRLANDGANVAIVDTPSKMEALEQLVKDIEAVGRKCAAITTDVSKEQEVQDMVKKTVETFGGLDIMVANAGIYSHGFLLEVSDESFDTILNVNLKGVLYCYRAAAVQMINQGRGGRIISASSVVGIQAGSGGNPAYAVSKFGVRAITQTAALEWGQHNITVNAYAPGVIDTPMVVEAGGGSQGEKFAEAILGNAGIKRPGHPEEVAAAVGFLASEGASYVTGQTIGVNGGFILS